jgi:uncharacterized repeat protein (TIGR01451 family)
MSRLLVAVTLLLLPFTALAQSAPQADVSMVAWVYGRLPAGDVVAGAITIRNHGPDPARNVVLTLSGGQLDGEERAGCAPGDDDTRCTIEVLQPHAERSFLIRFDPADVRARTVPIEATVTSDTPDPALANNHFRGSIEMVQSPRLTFGLRRFPIADPGGPAAYDVSIGNSSEVRAINTRFTIPLPEGWSFESATNGLQCTLDGRDLNCSVATIAPRTTFTSELVLRAANTPEGAIHPNVPVTLTTDHGVFTEPHSGTGFFFAMIYRHIAVTHTGDEGPGSLRDAINTVNASCKGHPNPPCKIVFDIPGEGAVRTIQPKTPLPAIRSGGVTIDGSTQTQRHGDTNPHGPEIEINGSRLEAGDAFDVSAENFTFVLSDVVVNGFPGNAVTISARGVGRLIERSYIGTDPTGRIAVPNTRGIVIDAPGQYYTVNTGIRDNVISGNRRAGIFITSGFEISIHANRIGASAGEVPQPLGNGASGIYLGQRASAVSITKNMIAFNGEAGIATAPDTGYISIRGNSITGNGSIGIDYNLDGASASFSRPTITVARYDEATGITRIEGVIEQAGHFSVSTVELFANSVADEEGELFLGSVILKGRTFTFDYRGDLRGRFITGTHSYPNNYYPEAPYFLTTEFGPPAKVDGEASGPIDPGVAVPRGADLSVRVTSISPVLVEARSQMYLQIGNLGPEPVEGPVTLELSIDAGRFDTRLSECTASADARSLRCTLKEAAPFYVHFEIPRGVTSFNVHARVTAATFDPIPANNEDNVTIGVITRPFLELQIDSPGAIDPGAEATYNVRLSSSNAVDSRDIEVRIHLMHRWSLISNGTNGWNCTVEGEYIVCRTPSLAGKSSSAFSFTLRAPGEEHGVPRQGLTASLTTSEGPQYGINTWIVYDVFRLLRVTTAADDGPGSLRQAIHRANDECNETINCKVLFANGIRSIEPLTELPWINAENLTLIGNDITIDGGKLAAGDGLTIASNGDGLLRGFIIRGFPGDGVVVRRFGYAPNYLSRRAIVGNEIVDNGGRGVVVITDNGESANTDIVANVISGNGRSGVSVASGTGIRVTGNRIGVSAQGGAMPNGASGVYAAANSSVELEGNTIAFNAHAGAGTDRNAMWIGLRGNSLFANHGLAVDHGLDEVTFNDDPKRHTELPRMPLILSATWDTVARVTRIEGRAELSPNHMSAVELFANDQPDERGFGEAQRSLGEVSFAQGRGETAFTFSVAEDLRGKFIIATLSRRNGFSLSWTSEVSQAVPVQ